MLYGESGAEAENDDTRRRGSVDRLRDLRDEKARDGEEDERRDRKRHARAPEENQMNAPRTPLFLLFLAGRFKR